MGNNPLSNKKKKKIWLKVSFEEKKTKSREENAKQKKVYKKQ